MDPQDYLRAGLPRPGWQTGLHARPPRDAAAVATPMPDLSRLPPDAEEPWAYTAVDGDGKPVEVAYARTDRYLVKPARWQFASGEKIVGVARQPFGSYGFELGDPEPWQETRMRELPDPETATIVTADPSVFIAGLRPSKFRPDDALFISMAMAIEIELYVSRRADEDRGRMQGSLWSYSVPVPLDLEVLWAYREMAFRTRGACRRGELDRTDLLCAATAAIYRAPMYTMKPEAYKGAGNGLKVLKYGKTRNKDANDEPVEVDDTPRYPVLPPEFLCTLDEQGLGEWWAGGAHGSAERDGDQSAS